MSNVFSLKSYYNPNISPAANSFWGVVSITANETPQVAQDTVISLICDVSGSMQGAKFNAVVETVEHLLKTAPVGIAINVVVFDDRAHEVLPITELRAHTDRSQLIAQFRKNVKQITIFHGTSMSTGIRQAIESQEGLRGNWARYGIFLTDGQNTEPETQLAASVQEAAQMQLHLCAYGYGKDWNPNQLTKMAEITQGWMPKAIPDPARLQQEFSALVARMAKTVASDVVLQFWTPLGAKILSLSQAYPEWNKGEAAPQGDEHSWVVPVPPMAVNDHRDFIVHIELANVGAKVVACKPSVVYVAGGQRIEEKGEQATWFVLQQTNDSEQLNKVHPVVVGYLGQGQLAASTRAMTEALETGDLAGAERHRTEALEIARQTGNKTMTEILEGSGTGNEVDRKTAALGTSTVSLTES